AAGSITASSTCLRVRLWATAVRRSASTKSHPASASNHNSALALTKLTKGAQLMTRNNPENTHMQSPGAKPNPGDEAARGTPGTGEDICPQCHGSGRIDGGRCPNCGGR